MDRPLSKISNTTAFIMVSCAVAIDIVQLLFTVISLLLFGIIGIVLNSILSVFASLWFGFWFKMKGVNLLTARRATLTFITLAVEILPGANNFTMWTLSIILGIKSVRKEEREMFEAEKDTVSAVDDTLNNTQQFI